MRRLVAVLLYVATRAASGYVLSFTGLCEVSADRKCHYTVLGGQDENAWKKLIGVLDMYGFESIEIDFPQLCTSFANETLQQFSIKLVFNTNEELYKEACVAWTRVGHEGCIDFTKLRSPTGIMRILLDETYGKPSCGHKYYCESVDQARRQDIMEPRAAGHKQQKQDGSEKHNDTLHPDTLGKSSNKVQKEEEARLEAEAAEAKEAAEAAAEAQAEQERQGKEADTQATTEEADSTFDSVFAAC